MQGAGDFEGLSIKQLAPLFSKRRDRLRGLTQQIVACWVCLTAVAGGIEKGREGLTEERKEREVLGLGHVPWWASMLHLSCAWTWNYGLMGFSAPWPPRLSGVLWEMWGHPSAWQQGNFTFSHCFSTVMGLLQLPYVVMSPRQDLMVLHIYNELSWKPIMFVMVMHRSAGWCIHWTTRLVASFGKGLLRLHLY